MKRPQTVIPILLGALIVLGLITDEVFHIHIKEEAFWTFPHVIIYLSILVIIMRVVWIFCQNRRTGKPLSSDLGLLAAISLLSGGIGDTVLHLAYDVQDGSLFTRPTHLLIWLGILLFCLTIFQ